MLEETKKELQKETEVEYLKIIFEDVEQNENFVNALLKVSPKGSFIIKESKTHDLMYNLTLLNGISDEIKQVLDEYDVVV